MRQTITVIPATLEHLDSICDLWREHQTILNQSDPRFPRPDRETETSFRQTIRNRMGDGGLVQVGVTRAGLAGYISGMTQNRRVFIDNIALDAHAYHIGLGHTLWRSILETAHQTDHEKLFISVPRYYAVEQAFWRSLGAIECKIESNDNLWKLPPELMWMTF